MSLPEIVELGKSIKKKSEGIARPSPAITETPADNNKGFYAIKVVEDYGELSIVANTGIYAFKVYIPSMKIMYVDPISSNDLTLDEWRKQNK